MQVYLNLDSNPCGSQLSISGSRFFNMRIRILLPSLGASKQSTYLFFVFWMKALLCPKTPSTKLLLRISTNQERSESCSVCIKKITAKKKCLIKWNYIYIRAGKIGYRLMFSALGLGTLNTYPVLSHISLFFLQHGFFKESWSISSGFTNCSTHHNL